MRRLILLALVALVPAAVAGQSAHGIMPAPRSIALSAGGLRLDSTFTVAIRGHRDGRLERGIERLLHRIEGRTATPLSRAIGTGDARLVVSVGAAGPAIPELGEDESYRIDVTAARATIEAGTVTGALRALETLLQLQETDSSGYVIRSARIDDAPRFAWRGVNIDGSRHFMPVEMIRRTLDGMSVAKLNVLHWHLSDDQGFRVESRTFPRLHQMGSDGSYYTHEQIREVVSYAADRGIRVVPEFDVPGHTTAWFVGHPELASAPGPYTIERRWGVFRPTMDPTRDTTYAFLDRFIAEMSTLFPDRYWHVGGDEVDATQWNTSTSIQQWMARNSVKDAHALQTHFNRRLFDILKKHARVPVGWDEILQPDLPQGAVIQSWRGMAGLTGAVRQGRQAILSAPWYLDHIKTSEEMYLEDLVPTGLGVAETALILGGEACMWAEYVTAETVDSRLWPRLAAVAERFWSPRETRDVGDMYRRLALLSPRLEEVGTLHASHGARMIRRMARGADARDLEEFLGYARPRGFAGRGTTQLSPLSRLIDAADPDPLTGWGMQQRARRARNGNAAAIGELRRDFARMATFPASLAAMQARVPMARDGIAVAGALATLSRLGNETLDRLGEPAKATPAWRARTDSLLKTIEGKTFGLLRPVGAEAVRILLGS